MGKLNFFESVKLLISFLLIFVVLVESSNRTLTAELNPNFPVDELENENLFNKSTLVHVKADGDNDTLHYIWDLTQQPTILVALCVKNTSVAINWTNSTPISLDKIEFSPKPKYTMSFVLTKVFMYDDVKNQASIIGLNESYIETIDTKYLTWNRESFINESSEVEVVLNGSDDLLLGKKGVINLKLNCFGVENHGSETPHLLHSSNVTQVDLEFIDLATNKSFDKLRIAAEFVMIAGESPTHNFTINKRKTVDDEHTPGTFTLVDIMSSNGTLGSYMQFRPISYTNKKRDITSKTDVYVNEPRFIDDAESYLNASMIPAYYGDTLDKNLVQLFNISFGKADDKSYSHSKYTTWTFVLGYGTAPPERISMIIAILACIGLGIPLILLITGGVYLAIKRMRNC